MKSVAIERRSGLTAGEFARDHLAGEGRPVILTDAVDGWAARTRWTFDFFRATYGADFVTARLSLFNYAAQMTRLADYLDHLDAQGPTPGIWIHELRGTPVAAPADSRAAYMLGWHAFARHPELIADIQPPPNCIEDWSLSLDPALAAELEEAGREFWSVYIGPAGSLSELHQDYGTTHSYLVQVAGSKRATLFSPGDSGFLYDGDVDPELPDLEKFPLYDHATAYVADFGPGELLFTPAGWWHHVRGLTKSITVSHNFHNSTNVEGYRAHVAQTAPKAAAAIPVRA